MLSSFVENLLLNEKQDKNQKFISSFGTKTKLKPRGSQCKSQDMNDNDQKNPVNLKHLNINGEQCHLEAYPVYLNIDLLLDESNDLPDDKTPYQRLL